MGGHKQLGKVPAWIIILLALPVMAVMGYITYRQQQAENQAAIPQSMDDATAKIHDYADKNMPGEPKSLSYKKAAIKLGTDMLTSTSGDEQAQAAVGMYFGYLFINTKTRVDYCRNLGVDITPFSSALERVNADDTEKARAIFHRVLPATEDQFYDQIRPSLEKSLAVDMNDISKQRGASMADVCRIFAQNGETIAGRLALANTYPVLHEKLQTLK